MEVYCMLVPGWNRKDLYGHFCINHILLDFFFFGTNLIPYVLFTDP